MSCNLESYTWCTMQRSSSNFTDFNHTIFNLQPKYPFLQLLCIASFTTHDIINFLITEKLSICKLFEKSSDVFIQTYKYDRGFAMFGGCLKTWFVKYSLLMLVSKAETCLSVFSTSLHQLGSLQFGIGSLNLEYDFQKTRGSLPPSSCYTVLLPFFCYSHPVVKRNGRQLFHGGRHYHIETIPSIDWFLHDRDLRNERVNASVLHLLWYAALILC